MRFKENGSVDMSLVTLLIGGLALAGLLFYGWKTGQELPLWPAVAVALVNIVAAARIAMKIKKSRK